MKTRQRRRKGAGARFTSEKAGNAGLIATVAMAFAGVLVGALSAYMGERGAGAAAMGRIVIPTHTANTQAPAQQSERDRIVRQIISGAPERLPAPRGALPTYEQSAARPKVVIILDDMGVDQRNSEKALDLPGPVTFSFLPYASHVQSLAKAAQASGAEIMLHLPMEPQGGADPGPRALTSNMSGGDFLNALEWNLDRFDGYIGVNNHMGSKLTEDIAVMKTLLGYLQHRGVFFLDSVTTSDSAARQAANDLDVDIFYRDVFLDDDVGNEEAIKEQLVLAERIARETGYVVAIGHPRKETMSVLGPWLTTAPARGFDLVFASALKEINAPPAQPQNFAAAPDLRL